MKKGTYLCWLGKSSRKEQQQRILKRNNEWRKDKDTEEVEENIAAGPTFELMKGSVARSLVELKYVHLRCAKHQCGIQVDLSRPNMHSGAISHWERKRVLKTAKAYVRSALDDILKRIQMKYLPQTVWRNVDNERAGAMMQAIDQQLRNKRIIRSLERFVGGRPYKGDLRLLERTIWFLI
ncbi:hypothetical protein Tco_1262871 [Tanacetum coccineum]|uniref:Reverse transcriptase N-terminal domain-containing protein n=1 Tax=Tanacetum coccineum TaxID=301880 RepID=A0ABQ5HMI4_9ASTR